MPITWCELFCILVWRNNSKLCSWMKLPLRNSKLAICESSLKINRLKFLTIHVRSETNIIVRRLLSTRDNTSYSIVEVNYMTYRHSAVNKSPRSNKVRGSIPAYILRVGKWFIFNSYLVFWNWLMTQHHQLKRAFFCVIKPNFLAHRKSLIFDFNWNKARQLRLPFSPLPSIFANLAASFTDDDIAPWLIDGRNINLDLIFVQA